MKLVKLLLVCLLSIISFNVLAAQKIVFLNGIDGNPTKNRASKDKLAEIMTKAGYGNKLSTAGVKYTFWSNVGDGFFDDKIELLVQARLSGQALTFAKQTNPSADAQSIEYYKKLGSLYDEKIKDGGADSEEARHVYSVVRDLANYISDEILVKGNQLIIVSHSQGNFFAEAVAAYLTVSKSVAENQKLDINLRFVGVASVAAGTPQYRYISAQQDNALDAHVASTALVANFAPLPRNITFCATLDPLCKPYLESTIDLTIHGFQETYTSNLYDKTTGKQVYKMLADLVIDSHNELPLSNTELPGFMAVLESNPATFGGITKVGNDVYVASLVQDRTTIRSNPDGSIFYKSSIVLTKIAANTIKWQKTVATDMYMWDNLSLSQLAIISATDGSSLRIATNSYTGTGYSMSSGIYAVNLATQAISYTPLFASANSGWYPYFAGTGQVNSFSYDGYLRCVNTSCSGYVQPNVFQTESENRALSLVGLNGNLTTPSPTIRTTLINQLKSWIGL